MTLLCFHAAGSGSAMYRRWPHLLPPSVETALIRMPGRESRLAEQPILDFVTAVTAFESELDGCFDRDYALFGHSMGAYLAFALATARVAVGLRPPRHVFVSGARPPHLFRPPSGRGRRTDADLTRLLAEMGGTDPVLLDNEEMRQIILRSFRADLSVCDSMRVPDRSLPCGLSVLGGESDHISREDLAEWSSWSTGLVSTAMFRGGHFFLNMESEAEVLTEVTHVLSGCRAGGGEVPA